MEPPAHGFVPGRSTVTNARGHAGKVLVVNVESGVVDADRDAFAGVAHPPDRHDVDVDAAGRPRAVEQIDLIGKEDVGRQVGRRNGLRAHGRRGRGQAGCGQKPLREDQSLAHAASKKPVPLGGAGVRLDFRLL